MKPVGIDDVEDPSEEDLSFFFFYGIFQDETRCDAASKTAALDPSQPVWNSLPLAIYTSQGFSC